MNLTTPAVRKVFLATAFLAFLVWVGVGYVWWNQRLSAEPLSSLLTKSRSDPALDRTLAQTHIPPTVVPGIKESIPRITNKPPEAVFFEPALIQSKAEDQIVVVTASADTAFSVGKDSTRFFWAEDSAEGFVTAGEQTDFASLREGQVIYLVRNDLGIIGQVLVVP